MPNSNPACTEPPVAEICTGITTPGVVWLHLPDIPWDIYMGYTLWLSGWTDGGISWELKCISGEWNLKYNIPLFNITSVCLIEANLQLSTEFSINPVSKFIL